jgi:hypothetical protein
VQLRGRDSVSLPLAERDFGRTLTVAVAVAAGLGFLVTLTLTVFVAVAVTVTVRPKLGGTSTPDGVRRCRSAS